MMMCRKMMTSTEVWADSAFDEVVTMIAEKKGRRSLMQNLR